MPAPLVALSPLGEKLLGLPLAGLSRIYKNRSWMRHCARAASKAAGVPYARRPVYRWLRKGSSWELLSRPTRHSPDELTRSIFDALLPRMVLRKKRWTTEHREQMAKQLAQTVPDAIFRFAPVQKTIDALHGQLSSVASDVGDIKRAVVPEMWEQLLESLPLGVRLALLELEHSDSARARRLAEVLSDVSEPPAVRIAALVAPESELLRDGPIQSRVVLAEFAAAQEIPMTASELFEAAARAGLSPVRHFSRASLAALQVDDRPRASQLITRALALQPLDPFARLVQASINDSLTDAKTEALAVASMDPPDPVPALIAARILYYHLDSAQAAKVCLRRVIDRFPDHTGALLDLAKILQRDATNGYQLERPNLLAEALRLAMRARDTRRRTHSPRGEAVAVAAECLALLDRDEEALSECLLAVEGGTADTDEASDSRVALLAIGLALDANDLDRVNKVVARVPEVAHDPLVKAQLALAGVQGERSDVQGFLDEALEAATLPYRKLQCLEVMASIGTWPLPIPDELAQLDPFSSQRLLATAEIESGRISEAIERLRKEKPFTSGLFVRLLARAYERRGDIDAAVDELRNGSRDLLDPTLRARCVFILQKSDRLADATADGEAALRDMHFDTPLRREIRRRLRDMAWVSGNWSEAARHARSCLLDDPDDVQSAWALVGALWNAQRGIDAWKELQRLRPAAITDQQAALWINLASSYASPDNWMDTALALADQFSDSASVGGAFFYATMLVPEEAQFEEADKQRIVSRNQTIIERHAEAIGIKAIPSDQLSIVLTEMTEQLKVRAQRLRWAVNNVLFGRGPYGLVALASGRSYAEALVTRAAGCLTSEAPDLRAVNVAAKSLDGGVVADASVLVTAAAVTVWELAQGKFRSILISAAQRGDLSQTVRWLSTQTVATIGLDADEQGLLMVPVDADQLARIRSEAATADHQAESCRVEETTRIEAFKAWPDEASSWLSAIDLAVDRGVPLWADDVGLRLLASSQGVGTFSTLDLIDALRVSGSITPEQAADIRRAMVQARIVDLILTSTDIYEIAAAESWAPDIAALQLTRARNWTDPTQTLGLFARVMDSVVSQRPGAVGAWVSLASLGVGAAVATSSPERAMARVACVPLFHESITPVLAREVLVGVRAAARQLGVADPMPELVRYFNDRSVAYFGPTQGATYVSRILSALDPDDHTIVTNTIIGS